MRIVTAIVSLLAVIAVALPLFAADPPPAGNAPATGQQQMQMPPIGPPAEMKQVAFMEGTWDVVGKFNISMDPSKPEWVDSKATVTSNYTIDGAAMQSMYNGEATMPGMPPMRGMMLMTYDRENKQWQGAWLDNMSGRISLYTGTCDQKGSVFQGDDKMMGQTWTTRITQTNQSPTKFDWKMESSLDGGKTWFTTGTATYTKKA